MAPAEWFYRAIREALRSDWVDAILVLYTQTGLSGPVETAKAILDAVREERHTKPLTVAFLGGPECIHATRLLTRNHIAAYPTPERAANALAYMALYAERRAYLEEKKRSG